MKKSLCSLILVAAALMMVTGTAMAIPLATYTHNYQTGGTDPGGNDVLSNSYVTVSNQSTQRFNDAFDFSGLSYSAISQFDLKLTFSNTNASLWGIIPIEFWYARPGATSGEPFTQYSSFGLNRVGNSQYSQTFVIDSTLVPGFNNMVTAENFYFWFAEEVGGNNSFKLYSAALTIDGTAAVPEPTTMLLLGLGLMGLAGIRRKFKG